MAPTVSDNLPRRSLIANFNAVIDEKGVVEAVVSPVPVVPAVILVVVEVVGVGVDERRMVDNCAISSCHLAMVVCNPSMSFSTLRMVPCKWRSSLVGGERVC